MALTLNAEQKSIYDIFSGKTHYYIPPYQRPYSWQIQHCRELFEDLKREFYNEEKEGYFLGNIVLAWSAEERNRFEVIDGQQRLITLLLLLKVLLVFDNKNSDIENAIWIIDSRTNEIKDTRLKFSDYLEEYNSYREILKLNLSDDICVEKIEKEIENDYDLEKLLNINVEDKEIKEKNLFRQNICFFYEEIKKLSQYEKIDRFVDFLLYDIYILPIETGGSTSKNAREKALKVFETINNRGLSLSNADILKARLYEESINRLEEDNFIVLWSEFENSVNKIEYSIDNIFSIYMNIILAQKKGSLAKFKIRTFFIENEYSPFSYLKYNEIIDNLLKIVYAIQFFEDVKINPEKYGELTKWFQIIYEFESDVILYHDSEASFIVDSFLLIIIRLYFSDLEDHKQIILDLKKIIRYLISIDTDMYGLIIKIVHNGNITWNNNFFIKNKKALTLLSFYLNKNQKAIYPYYFIKIDNREFQDIYGNMIILNFDIPENIDLTEKMELINNSKMEDNINLIKNFKKNKILLFEKIKMIPVLQQQINILKERIEKFLKNED